MPDAPTITTIKDEMGKVLIKRISSVYTWEQIPNTTIRSVSPPNGAWYNFQNQVPNIMAFSGGVYDSVASRILTIGGGHNDYLGNEIYASTAAGAVSRIWGPTPDTDFEMGDDETYDDGNPSSRHTYGNVGFFPALGISGKLFLHGGIIPAGTTAGDNWMYDIDDEAWTCLDPTNGTNPAGVLGACCVVDNVLYWFDNIGRFFSYVPGTNTWTRHLKDLTPGYTLGISGVYCPTTNEFITAGRKYATSVGVLLHATKIASPYTNRSVYLDATPYWQGPGIAWNSVLGRLILWGGAGTVYEIDPSDLSIDAAIAVGGAPSARSTGTYGRFAYVASEDAILYVGSVDANAYWLRKS